MAVTVPINADLRALWDERYGSYEPVRLRQARYLGDYLIAAGLTVCGLAMGAASLTI